MRFGSLGLVGALLLTLLQASFLVSGALAAAVDFTPSSIDFGAHDVGTISPSQTITLTHNEGPSVTFGPATLVGGNTGDFTIVADACNNVTLPLGASCTVMVRFAPTTAGNLVTNVSIEATSGTYIVPLNGTAAAAPALNLAPSALDFGAQEVGTASASRTITATNSGNSPVSLSGVSLGGATEFAIVSDTCQGNVLTPGQSCQVAVRFTPAASGPRGATLSFTHGGSGSPQTVQLSGTGVAAPALDLAPSSLAFGSQASGTQGAPQTLTLTNTGTAPLALGSLALAGPDASQFILVSDACSAQVLAPGQSCSVTVRFAPTTAGAKSAAISVPSDAAGSPASVALSGTAPAEPALAFAPSALAFGDQQIGTTSASQTLTLTSIGTGPLTVGSIALAGVDIGQFALVNDTCSGATLAPGQSCTIDARFAPTTTGAKSATVSVPSDAPATASVPLSGTCTAPGLTLTPGSLAFGNQIVNTQGAPLTLSVTNTGSAPLTVGSLALTEADASQFTLSGDTCSGATLAPGQSCSVSVRFAPTTTGAKSAAVSVPSNAPGSPHSAALSGTGIAPALGLAPSNLAFVSQATGTQSASQTLTLTNTGAAPLALGSLALSGADADQFGLVSDTCSAQVLQAGQSCTVAVRFVPTTVGAKSAALTIPSDAATSPDSVALSGTGSAPTAPAVALSPSGTVSFGAAQVATQSAPQTITVTNVGDAALHVGTPTLTGDTADFAIVGNGCTVALAPVESCTIQVRFTPASVGAKAATLAIPSDAAGSPNTVALDGTGTAPTAPALTLAPSSLAFGSQVVDTMSASQTLTLTNTGTAPLALGSLALAGADASQFTLVSDTCSGATLAPGQSCAVTARFAPTTVGSKSAAIAVPSNAASSPNTVLLSGTGTSAPVATTLAVAPATATYGDTATLSATLRDGSSAPLAGKSVAFTLGGAAVGSATTDDSGVATLTGVPIGTRAVGGYANLVGANFAGDGGTLASGGTATLTVTKATLTVTAASLTRAYGVANGALTVGYSGFVNGDTATVLTGRPTIATTATAASNVGSYPITVAQNTLGAANYAFVFVNGSLAVTPAPLTIAAVDKTRAYGAANPALTLKCTGFKQGDDAGDLGGAPSLATAATPTSPAGAYPIVVGQGTLGTGNYSYTFVNGTLTVTAANTAVSAVSGAATYGGTATLTATLKRAGGGGTPIAGATLAFTLGGTAVGSATTDANGVATLAGAALGGRGAGNYSGLVGATFAGDASQASDSATGTLRVAKAALVLRATDQTRRVGQANPACQVQLAAGSSFVNGDTLAALDRSNLSCNYGGAKANSPAGTYTLTPRGVTSANYTITYQNGTLTVTP